MIKNKKFVWNSLGNWNDLNTHVISTSGYSMLKVLFKLEYTSSTYIVREYYITISSGNYAELFVDGFYYDINNYASWSISYDLSKQSLQIQSSWLKMVTLGKSQACKCNVFVYGK